VWVLESCCPQEALWEGTPCKVEVRTGDDVARKRRFEKMEQEEYSELSTR